jgi:hypothetical protein
VLLYVVAGLLFSVRRVRAAGARELPETPNAHVAGYQHYQPR